MYKSVSDASYSAKVYDGAASGDVSGSNPSVTGFAKTDLSYPSSGFTYIGQGYEQESDTVSRYKAYVLIFAFNLNPYSNIQSLKLKWNLSGGVVANANTGRTVHVRLLPKVYQTLPILNWPNSASYQNLALLNTWVLPADGVGLPSGTILPFTASLSLSLPSKYVADDGYMYIVLADVDMYTRTTPSTNNKFLTFPVGTPAPVLEVYARQTQSKLLINAKTGITDTASSVNAEPILINPYGITKSILFNTPIAHGPQALQSLGHSNHLTPLMPNIARLVPSAALKPSEET